MSLWETVSHYFSVPDETVSYTPLIACTFRWVCLWTTIFHPTVRFLGNTIQKKHWWSAAKIPVKAMMVNFGYSSNVLEGSMCQGFAWTLLMSIHHTMAATLMIPVVFGEWNACAQTMFIDGLLAAVSFDLYDLICLSIRYFFPGKIFTYSAPGLAYVILGLHHISSILAMPPLIRRLPLNPHLHFMAFNFLLGAGICYGFGQYKYTLNIRTRWGLRQVQAISCLQFICILWTRVYLWMTCGYHLVLAVHPIASSYPDLYLAYIGMVSMSVFNIVMLFDATSQLIKWSKARIE
jgi:hypothetical protein